MACTENRRDGAHYAPATELAVIGADPLASPRSSALTGIKSVIRDLDLTSGFPP
ncbi:hypothetical protein ABLA76_06180 [Xenorhabdus sp. SGI240]